MAEKKVDAGLAAGILLLPQVFGWAVLREGYGIATRFVVFTYMIVSSIPLYFLIMTLWTSGGDLVGMAKDYDRNRSVTERNIGEAQSYMDDYQRGDLQQRDAGTLPAATADQNKVSAGDAIDTTAENLARTAEAGGSWIDTFKGKSVRLTGKATADASGGLVYLAGTDLYPAVTVHMDDTAFEAETGEDVTVTCDQVAMGTAGPELRKCR